MDVRLLSSGKLVGRMTISVVVIAKNEARNITDCLESVQWVDERILVDGESSDQTVEIARGMNPGVRVFTRPWPGFGPQKNFGIAQASSDWVLILDADERVTLALQHEIQNLLCYPGLGTVAYRIPRRNFLWGHWVRYGGMYPDYQIRLFKKETALYNDVFIHENLLVKGSIGTLRNPLDHYTERCIGDHLKKMDEYTTLAARRKLETFSSVSWYHLLFNPLLTLCKVSFLKQGVRDGVVGFINSLFSAMYTFLKYAKTWEASRKVRRPQKPL
ncbi:MAG: glycosyl transferase family 2 [Nitrospiraceae bacterium]|nr:glycosyl transferase family 2 [Nitrospiraceae bacterium]|tara:strand:- start:1090 stop:1908 length:819 start_codon:yes stop_codon:yes gene_type:complete